MKYLAKILITMVMAFCISSGLLSAATYHNTSKPTFVTVADLFDVDDSNF